MNRKVVKKMSNGDTVRAIFAFIAFTGIYIIEKLRWSGKWKL
jgi:hypothetical protein